MPRLTPITKREQVSGDALTAFDAIIESRSLAEKCTDLDCSDIIVRII